MVRPCNIDHYTDWDCCCCCCCCCLMWVNTEIQWTMKTETTNIPTPGLTERTFDRSALSKGNLHFCVCSTPLPTVNRNVIVILRFVLLVYTCPKYSSSISRPSQMTNAEISPIGKWRQCGLELSSHHNETNRRLDTRMRSSEDILWCNTGSYGLDPYMQWSSNRKERIFRNSPRHWKQKNAAGQMLNGLS